MTDFDTLRKRILQHDPLEKGTGTIDISENNMFLTMVLPREFWYIRKLDEKFQAIKRSLKKCRCADTAIWELTDSGRWVLHIIEIKQSVTQSSSGTSWDYIKSQLVVAYRLCKMAAAAFDVEFEKVVFYTAFINDNEMSIRTIGNKAESDDTEDPCILLPDRDMPDDMPSPRIEWASGKCRLDDKVWSDSYTNKEYVHIKIQLTKSDDDTLLPVIIRLLVHYFDNTTVRWRVGHYGRNACSYTSASDRTLLSDSSKWIFFWTLADCPDFQNSP